MMKAKRKVILLILDGWGYREEKEYNAIALSNPINYNKLLAEDPSILIDASEEFVGLPKGQMGNSEVGHTNLGAGRVVYQDLLKISLSFKNGEALKIPAFVNFIKNVKNKTGRAHLFGLVSDGGVHSHIDHFKDAIKELHANGVKEIYVHAVTDGRDTPPHSGLDYVSELDNWMKEQNAGMVADVCGRFYAMDRDKRWDRVEAAYNMLFNGEAERAADVKSAIQKSYDAGVTDEFIKPTIIDGANIKGADSRIKDGDGMFFMNFRADRVREMLAAVYKDSFDGFKRAEVPHVEVLTMTDYDGAIPAPAMFPAESLKNVFGEVLSNLGMKQLRIAETEKYAHVTYFFNGGREEPFSGEERILVPSPRDVATYDLKPEMSVGVVEKKFQERFEKGDIDAVIMNFANPDMVGHTGVLEAAIEACKVVDEMLGKVVEVADKQNAVLLITADHGNCELMWDKEHNQPYTSHTTNPVKLVIHNYPCKFNIDRGKLADIAPTMLKIMGIPVPAEMTGHCLID